MPFIDALFSTIDDDIDPEQILATVLGDELADRVGGGARLAMPGGCRRHWAR